MSDFTIEQIKHFLSYEEIRKRGAYNMFDPNARRATGLDKESYMFVMKTIHD